MSYTIKPLEWAQVMGGPIWRAETILRVTYHVAGGGHDPQWGITEPHIAGGTWLPCESVEDGKRLAELDYHKRLSVALAEVSASHLNVDANVPQSRPLVVPEHGMLTASSQILSNY